MLIYCRLYTNDILWILRKCGSPKKQNIKSLGRALGAVTLSNDKPSNLLLVRSYHEVTGDIICPSMVQGIDHLRDPRLNKVCIWDKRKFSDLL